MAVSEGARREFESAPATPRQATRPPSEQTGCTAMTRRRGRPCVTPVGRKLQSYELLLALTRRASGMGGHPSAARRSPPPAPRRDCSTSAGFSSAPDLRMPGTAWLGAPSQPFGRVVLLTYAPCVGLDNSDAPAARHAQTLTRQYSNPERQARRAERDGVRALGDAPRERGGAGSMRP